jgi:hypothetical protein
MIALKIPYENLTTKSNNSYAQIYVWLTMPHK